MQLVRLQLPFRVAAAPIQRSVVSLLWSHRPEIPQLRPASLVAAVEGRRNASVRAQGAYKIKFKRTIMKKLGAKKTGEQYVIPGNIIYKQRGTIWHPGENTIMGRDHTIHAAITGFVKYYRDPARHPNRQYIGVAHERADTLPYPPHAVRKRKLGMTAVPISTHAHTPAVSASRIPSRVVRVEDAVRLPAPGEAGKGGKMLPALPKRLRTRVLHLQDDYSYMETSSALGRLMPRLSFAKYRLRLRGWQLSKAAEAKRKKIGGAGRDARV